MNIIFIDEKNGQGFKWYNNINKLYKNILAANKYNVITKSFAISGNYIINTRSFDEIIGSKAQNNIYIFNPINFATFLYNPGIREKVYEFLNKLRYIIIWQEILCDDMSILGYNKKMIDPTFISFFFKNSIINLCSNLISINSLVKNGICKNKYFQITGYSPINNIIAFENENIKDIDIFIYGSMNKVYKYRNQFIKKINLENKNNLHIVIKDNVYGKDLDVILVRTKIVVHVPSYQNLDHMPWPKITYLQARGIFYIIEDNKELHDKNLDHIVTCYKKNDVVDLYNKINYYLNNDSERIKLIDINKKFSEDNNIDKIVPNIIKEIIK